MLTICELFQVHQWGCSVTPLSDSITTIIHFKHCHKEVIYYTDSHVKRLWLLIWCSWLYTTVMFSNQFSRWKYLGVKTYIFLKLINMIENITSLKLLWQLISDAKKIDPSCPGVSVLILKELKLKSITQYNTTSVVIYRINTRDTSTFCLNEISEQRRKVLHNKIWKLT